MNTQKTLFILVILIALAAVFGFFSSRPLPAPSTSVSNEEDSAIRAVVTGFGQNLQKVSLLAPADQLRVQMSAVYGAYVAPELLQAWRDDSTQALGRSTSSPWPDRIEVTEVHPQGTTATVEGNVIEVTSVEMNGTKDPVAVYPVHLTLEKRNGQWLITKVSKGAYSELPQRQTISGVWECLPHKDTTGPQTEECAFGIAVDQSDAHYAVDTSLMSTYPVDFATGSHVRIEGIVTPVEQLSSIQKYDIDGIIRATKIQEVL